MRCFGLSAGGGRRSSPRSATPMLAVIMTLSSRRSAVVVDISCTGVGLSGSELPGEGEVLEIKIDRFSTFGTVVWQTDTQCGVAFDPCLEEHEVEVLRSRAGKASLAAMSVEERIALEDWVLGVSR